MKITMNCLSANNTSFGMHYISADIGASVPEGSLKMRLLDENGKTLAEQKKTVFEKYDNRSEDLFEKRVAQRLIDFKNSNIPAIKEADPEDKTKVTICYPGPVTDEGVKLTNFTNNKTGKKFERYINPEIINSNLVITKAINLDTAKHVNDMAAAGTSLLAKLKDMEENWELPDNVLTEGKEILYLYPGGGLGSGVIMIDKDENNNQIFKIKPTEKQHTLNHNYSTPRILEADVCSSGLIDNFVDSIADACTEINILNTPIRCEEKYCQLYKNLREKFADNTMLIDYPTNQKAYADAKIPKIKDSVLKNANFNAIDCAMDSLAQIIAHQICDKNTNTVIIAGNIGNAIKKSVKNNDLFKTDKYENIDNDSRFDEILKDKVRNNLMAIGNNLMGKNKDFNILTIPLQDNTEGEHLLHNSWQVGQNSPSWFNIRNNQPEKEKKLELNI